MPAPSVIWQPTLRMFACKKQATNTLDSPDNNMLSFDLVTSLRPFLDNADDQWTLGQTFFNPTATHPAPVGEPPDAPWFHATDAPTNETRGTAWVGERKEAYVVVSSGDADPAQRLYVCDEFFSTADLLQTSWNTQLSGGATGAAYRAIDMIHFKTHALEGLCVYSASEDPTKDDRFLAWFDFDGNSLSPGLTRVEYQFDQVITDAGDQRDDLLWMARGPATAFMPGGIIATVKKYGYDGGLAVDDVEFRIEIPQSGQILSQVNYAPGDAVQTYYGQPTFDFVNDRILFPEQVYAYDAGDDALTQTTSRIMQITRDNSGISWTAANTTVALFLELPTDSFAPDPMFPDILRPEIYPLVCWHNEIDDCYYVWFGVGTDDEFTTTSGLYGLVRYDADGNNPVVIFDKGFEAPRWGASASRNGWFFGGDTISFGPGTRAPWEI